MVTKICRQCHKEYTRRKGCSFEAWRKSKYCSRRCYWDSLKIKQKVYQLTLRVSEEEFKEIYKRAKAVGLRIPAFVRDCLMLPETVSGRKSNKPD